METRASNIAVGTFVLVLIVAAIGFIFWVGRFSERTATSTYYARFAGSVAGLDVGSNVLFGGIPIGHVTSIKVDPAETSLARVDMTVDASVPIKQDSVATLDLQGITGGVLVEITRGYDATPKLAPGSEIRSGYSPLERLITGAPDLIANGNDLLKAAKDFLNHDNAVALNHVLNNVDKLTTLLANDSAKFDAVIDAGNNALQQVGAMSAEFQKLAIDLRNTTGKLGNEANNTLAQIRVMSGDFSKTAKMLTDVLGENRAPIHDFTSTGLYELTQMIIEVRLLAQTINRVTIEIERDPARFFFGDRQKGFQAQ
jgi:phospholipid/cholesterol/gamma-HCH transport system substrate-binding protein